MLAELSPRPRALSVLPSSHSPKPYGLTDYVVPVDHYFGIRKAYFSSLFEVTVHVDHYILHIFLFSNVGNAVALFCGWEYVRYLPVKSVRIVWYFLRPRCP